ncbi:MULTISPECIES: ATP-grasp domain-containing protein [Sorangium]|uniref:ATP-grasp domain-containing protein n=1 Tax=Sorangium atrum TaxID=2995308 RepID=A0ABT5BTD7_9BACT|nr:ATP-grasp domain-containing protein [Sorangium aterium]MDC0677420.1 ATP-grasp domain-containing protein [Sorangium aterium]
MAHVLLVGGHEDTVGRITSTGVKLTVFQSRAMATPQQVESATRLFVFNYEDLNETLQLARAVHAVEPVSAALSFTEYGLEPAAAVCEALGVPGNPPGAVRATRDKVEMRRLLAGGDVGTTRFSECPSFEHLERFHAEISGPLILKPARGSGSEGVSMVRDGQGLRAAWDRSSAAGVLPLMAEEFIDGEEISVETQSVDGRHEVVAITEKLTTGEPGFVEVGHQMPARFDPSEAERISACVLRFLDRIGHRHGPAHTELRLSSRGPRIIESNTRPGGDFIWELALLTRGVDFVKETVRALVGLPQEPRRPVAEAAAVRFFAVDGGALQAIEGLDEARAMPGVVRVSCSAKPGDALGPILSSDSRQGYVIATGASREEAISRASAAHARVRFVRA